jgi:hypothetical protein
MDQDAVCHIEVNETLRGRERLSAGDRVWWAIGGNTERLLSEGLWKI